MNDFINSIKLNLYNKAVSPLFGYYAISWVVWNYKIIFTLFSSLPVNEKFTYIDNNIFIGDNYIYLLPLFVYPFITSIIAIYALPFPAEWVYKFHKTKQEKLVEIKQNIEGNTLLSLEQSRKLRKDIRDLQDEKVADFEKKDQEIEDLKLELKSIEKQYKKLIDKQTNEINDLQDKSNSADSNELIDITEDEKNILLLFADSVSISDSKLEPLVKEKLNISSRAKYDYYINILKGKDLINTRTGILSTTKKAKELMVKNNLVN